MIKVETELTKPFGMIATVPEGTDFLALDPDELHAWVREHRVLVIRGLKSFPKRDMPRAARQLGPLLAWEFGAINELVPDKDAKNYLYTNREVPLHWDGAFFGKVPRYLFFHCLEAPDVKGGETIFVDTTLVWTAADDETRDRWRSLTFVYETDKLAHYGGHFEARVVSQHPITHDTVIRFAEPVDDLNPVAVHAKDLGPLDSAKMITELRHALAQEHAVLAHAWTKGDVVIADNHALLHGRAAFEGGEKRHIRRINVLDSDRTWLDDITDSIRIRRPEFMVAEIPILLIPMLLAWRAGTKVSVIAELVALFFLLFHFGDMINCFADRDLDAVYKTRLSEAVFGLGPRNVLWQITLTVLAAIGLSIHLASVTGHQDLVLLVLFGLSLGAQYSVGPIRFKSRGPLQVVALWAVIFVGPMLLVARTLGSPLEWPLLALIAAYGAMQEGIILINTAEDLPEDRTDNIRTTAVALGLRNCITLALAMVTISGAIVITLFARAGHIISVLPLSAAWLWVVWEIARIRALVRNRNEVAAIKAFRPRARRMPFWITATAWTSLWAAWTSTH